MIAMDKALSDNLGSLYDNVVWTHKIHEKQADIDALIGKILQWTSIFLMAVSSTGIISTLVFDYAWIKILTSITSALALFVSIAREAKAYELTSSLHASYAKDYLALRGEMECMVSSDEVGAEKMRKDAKCVRCKYYRLNSHSPRTGKLAVRLAEKALKEKEFRLFSQLFTPWEEGSDES